MRIINSHNVVFLIPVMAVVLGLLATATEIRRSEAQRNELLQERFESDAGVRLLVRDTLAQRLQTHMRGFIQALSTTSTAELEQTI